jgi:hypothetical protein
METGAPPLDVAGGADPQTAQVVRGGDRPVDREDPLLRARHRADARHALRLQRLVDEGDERGVGCQRPAHLLEPVVDEGQLRRPQDREARGDVAGGLEPHIRDAAQHAGDQLLRIQERAGVEEVDDARAQILIEHLVEALDAGVEVRVAGGDVGGDAQRAVGAEAVDRCTGGAAGGGQQGRRGREGQQ